MPRRYARPMKPFLLLATRAEDEAADGEYAAFLTAGGLEPPELHRVRLESGPMPRIDLDDYSGLIVGGSPFTTSDPTDEKSDIQLRVEAELAELIDEIIARDFPFLGACYGIGLLGGHLGGVVDTSWPEPVGPVEVALTADGAEDPVFAALPERFAAFVGHKEACSMLPTGAVLLATGEACPVQAFRIGRHVYATQFHPELTREGIATRIRVYRDHGYFEPEEVDALIAVAAASDVSEPGAVVRGFVEAHGVR
ncbi:MAG: hypothetical protein RI885_1032 [Actinomycetota bacterium]